MTERRMNNWGAPLAAALTVLALSTVALSDGLFFTEAVEHGQVLNAAGQRISGDIYVSTVNVGEPFSHSQQLTGGRLVMGTGWISKKKLMLDQAPPPTTGVEPADSPTFTNRFQGNFPNPFNPATTLRFSLAESRHTTMRIYDVRGRLVRTLVDGTLEVGEHDLRWDGRNNAGLRQASGVYFVRLVSGDFVEQRKMVMSR